MPEEEKKEEAQKAPEKESVDTEFASQEEDPIHRIPITRHLWPEEVEAKKLRKQNHRLKIGLIMAVVLCLAGGLAIGSLYPIPVLSKLSEMSSDNKMEEALKIMTQDWYFSSGIDNVEERLTDQAVTGMTTNAEDTHTEYMSKEEIASFTQSINRNFVGIGITYIASDTDLPLVQRVIKGSPAEEAGVQPGDIIEAVDGTSVKGKTSEEIAAMCKGEAGTSVSITFLRQGQDITLSITRREISSTVYGDQLDNGIGYLEIVQFGDSTGDEVRAYLDEFKAAGITKLMIDLRDDGGGYLNDLQDVAGCFVPKGTTVLREVFKDSSEKDVTTTGEPYDYLSQIVILVNENTASAAEAFTLAMKESRRDVTLIGTTTYGKGTVQVTRYFTDGSALKYTEAKWLSKNGVWVNGTGITPDIELKLHDILYTTFTAMNDDETFALDSVSDFTKEAQLALDYLGYAVDRKDGYFSQATRDALSQFQKDRGLTESGILDATSYKALVSAVVRDWNTSRAHDLQYAKALEVLNG